MGVQYVESSAGRAHVTRNTWKIRAVTRGPSAKNPEPCRQKHAKVGENSFAVPERPAWRHSQTFSQLGQTTATPRSLYIAH